jgi:hypothetical protein
MGTKELGHHAYALRRLSTITQEYTLQQLAKLHDPADGGRGVYNLTLEYVADFGDWDQETLATIRVLKVDLDVLAKSIRRPRNKLLSHNDLATIAADKAIGGFAKDADVEYFELLAKLVWLVHEKAVGVGFVFSNFARNDGRALIEALASAGAES